MPSREHQHSSPNWSAMYAEPLVEQCSKQIFGENHRATRQAGPETARYASCRKGRVFRPKTKTPHASVCNRRDTLACSEQLRSRSQTALARQACFCDDGTNNWKGVQLTSAVISSKLSLSPKTRSPLLSLKHPRYSYVPGMPSGTFFGSSPKSSSDDEFSSVTAKTRTSGAIRGAAYVDISAGISIGISAVVRGGAGTLPSMRRNAGQNRARKRRRMFILTRDRSDSRLSRGISTANRAKAHGEQRRTFMHAKVKWHKRA